MTSEVSRALKQRRFSARCCHGPVANGRQSVCLSLPMDLLLVGGSMFGRLGETGRRLGWLVRLGGSALID